MQCKATLARFSGQALGRLFYNQTPNVGSTVSQFAEAHPVPASSPYTVTVTNSGHFVADQGVTLRLDRPAADRRRVLAGGGAIYGQFRDRRLHFRRG